MIKSLQLVDVEVWRYHEERKKESLMWTEKLSWSA